MNTHKLLILLGVCIALLGCALYAVQLVITVAFSIAAMVCVAIGILMIPKKGEPAPPLLPPAKSLQLPPAPVPKPTGKISEGVEVAVRELPTGVEVVPMQVPMTPEVKAPAKSEAPAPVVTEKPAPTIPGGVDLEFSAAEAMKAKHSFIGWWSLNKTFASVTGANEPAGVKLTAGILVGFDEEKKEFVVWVAGAEQKKIKEVREVTRCAHKEEVVQHVKELMQKVDAGTPIYSIGH